MTAARRRSGARLARKTRLAKARLVLVNAAPDPCPDAAPVSRLSDQDAASSQEDMPMTTRRRFLAAAPALFSLSLIRPAFAADPDSAAAFVDQLLKDLLAIANGSQATAEKRSALARVVEAKVDLHAGAGGEA